MRSSDADRGLPEVQGGWFTEGGRRRRCRHHRIARSRRQAIAAAEEQGVTVDLVQDVIKRCGRRTSSGRVSPSWGKGKGGDGAALKRRKKIAKGASTAGAQRGRGEHAAGRRPAPPETDTRPGARKVAE
jgi:hypothetical protein